MDLPQHEIPRDDIVRVAGLEEKLLLKLLDARVQPGPLSMKATCRRFRVADMPREAGVHIGPCIGVSLCPLNAVTFLLVFR